MKYLVALLIISVSFALPQSTGYVNDFANILTDSAALEQELVAYERNTTIEIAVVTLDTLPANQNLFTYGVELFDQWGIGKKGEDNGILVLLVRNGTTGNRMRIELGYGIQGYITGAEAGRVLDEAMPYYQAGNYQGATEVILAGLKAQLTNYTPGQQSSSSEWDILYLVLSNFPLVIFLIIFIISVAVRNRCPYCLRGRLKKQGDQYVCQRCGRKISKKKRYAPVFVGGFGGGGGGFGGGGFGGGGSGGGGAGR